METSDKEVHECCSHQKLQTEHGRSILTYSNKTLSPVIYDKNELDAIDEFRRQNCGTSNSYYFNTIYKSYGDFVARYKYYPPMKNIKEIELKLSFIVDTNLVEFIK